MKMWEGPGRDRQPLEMTKDASGYASWRDRTLTVVACKYPLVRDLLLLAEREKKPIGDMTEVALAAKAGLPNAEVRLLSDTILTTSSCCQDAKEEKKQEDLQSNRDHFWS